MSAIDDTWHSVSWLGPPVDEGAGSAEMALPDGRGRARDFQHGTIVWSPQTGAHEVHGDIRVTWAELGSTRWLGYPTTDELPCPDGVGRYNHFEHGSISWTPATGAHPVFGALRDLWAQLGWERGRLRYPVSDESGPPDRRTTRFQGGSITWTPSGGAKAAYNID